MDTLQELEGRDWGDPSSGETTMIRRCLALRRKPISDFLDEDLRLMIGQQIGCDHLVPIALDVVEANPLAGGNMFDGALIEVLTRIDLDWWSSNPTEEARFRSIIELIDWNDNFEAGVQSSAESWFDARSKQPGGGSHPAAPSGG